MNFAPLSGVIANDNVALVFPATGTYDTASVGTAKTVTASGLSLSGTKANDYSIAGSVSGPVGEITGVQAPEAPVLTSVTAATQAASSASLTQTSFTITSLLSRHRQRPSQRRVAPVPATVTVAPPRPNPLESLVLSSSSAGANDQSPAEPPTSSDAATNLVVASMDGGYAPEAGVSNKTTIIIPGLLQVVPGKPQTNPSSGDDLSAWAIRRCGNDQDADAGSSRRTALALWALPLSGQRSRECSIPWL